MNSRYTQYAMCWELNELERCNSGAFLGYLLPPHDAIPKFISLVHFRKKKKVSPSLHIKSPSQMEVYLLHEHTISIIHLHPQKSKRPSHSFYSVWKRTLAREPCLISGTITHTHPSLFTIGSFTPYPSSPPLSRRTLVDALALHVVRRE